MLVFEMELVFEKSRMAAINITQVLPTTPLSHCLIDNSLGPSDAYTSANWPALVRIMACRLVGAMPLSEPMLEYCYWLKQISMKFESKFIHFHSRKCSSNVVCEMAAILSPPQCVLAPVEVLCHSTWGCRHSTSVNRLGSEVTHWWVHRTRSIKIPFFINTCMTWDQTKGYLRCLHNCKAFRNYLVKGDWFMALTSNASLTIVRYTSNLTLWPLEDFNESLDDQFSS